MMLYSDYGRKSLKTLPRPWVVLVFVVIAQLGIAAHAAVHHDDVESCEVCVQQDGSAPAPQADTAAVEIADSADRQLDHPDPNAESDYAHSPRAPPAS